MANPASVDGLPAVVVTGTDEVSIELNGDRRYSVAHNTIDNTGAADGNPVYLAIGAAVVASAAEGANKLILIAGMSLGLPPGVTQLRLKTAAGAPTVTILPDKRQMGQF